MKAYPIKFNPILKEKIWGGNKLGHILGKQTSQNNIGESWEISDVNGNISVVNNGAYKGTNLKDLIATHKAELLGAENFANFGYNFPLLIKFLDAKTDLSVQVHPDDVMAKKYHNSFGKTEMWYIMDSDTNADIVLGLKDKNTNPELLNHITAKNVEAIFNREQVKKGDSYFIPAGKIHAIGAGVLAAEIQQTSDVTYRVYDWDRTDDAGQKRELHTKLAEQATKHFKSNGKANYSLKENTSSNLVSCDFFTTNILDVTKKQIKDYSQLDSFVIFMCVEGETTITVENNTETMRMGETVLVPANAGKVVFKAQNAKILEVFISSKIKHVLQQAS
ncbi:type I phosphomannose isomerase catalytic subunit [Lacinutrix sp. 5H-3-7-4]|uniref:type I phosphomannose isomerase catalytic subunit n=1 Tax=Lacinutrix sp. (strain 5H-3-7-4) TaxID=983544 RepID=UPI00020A380D|nr:type I phosphomannose isomerase catalytic subunit [Lacinutrix sp. 5H-3-7-4]AEH01200.1 mannose-6-phosphate isomerase, class I [Lacinutrix sp. 5H-3-7-4]